MKPILPGGRGAAVEDIQRRLLVLGHDLGPTGVDGVFLGRTRDAVAQFQRDHELSEDGMVGRETWSALVDATFALGDRMLYLRLPHFHGRDVAVLQEALNSLGFSCGDYDAIFGPGTERAVREFQRNSGLPADGIVGSETVRTIEHLRHVWAGKAGATPEMIVAARAPRLTDVLCGTSVAFMGLGSLGRDVAMRSVNLALATDPSAAVMLAEEADADVAIRLELGAASEQVSGAQPVVAFDAGNTDAETFMLRLRTALEARPNPGTAVRIELPQAPVDEHGAQRLAVQLIDSLRAALA